MSKMSYLIAANAAIWIGLGSYAVWLLTRYVSLARRKQQLDILGDSHDR
ncbi:MAG: CcmD family protein [Desulfovibrio sp.]